MLRSSQLVTPYSYRSAACHTAHLDAFGPSYRQPLAPAIRVFASFTEHNRPIQRTDSFGRQGPTSQSQPRLAGLAHLFSPQRLVAPGAVGLLQQPDTPPQEMCKVRVRSRATGSCYRSHTCAYRHGTSAAHRVAMECFEHHGIPYTNIHLQSGVLTTRRSLHPRKLLNPSRCMLVVTTDSLPTKGEAKNTAAYHLQFYSVNRQCFLHPAWQRQL